MALVKYNNNSISAVTSTGLATGSLVPIKTLTASGSATLSFVHGTDGVVLDSTYPIYKFEFINMHPSANARSLTFQTDTGTNTNYNIACTSTSFEAYHNEPDNDVELRYDTQYDNAQSTSFIHLASEIMSVDDASCSGTLTIFSPSSDTFVKHWISEFHGMRNDVYAWRFMKAGYFNTTTALTRFQFKLNSGNIDAGKIKLYGIKDS